MDEELLNSLIVGIGIIVGLGLLTLVVYVLYRFFSGFDELGSMVDEEEKLFEQEAVEELMMAAPPAVGEGGQDKRETPEPHAPADPEGTATPAEGASEDVEELAQRLYKLRIVTEMEGRIPLPLKPDGLIYRMRSGKTCGILPRLESEAQMQHFCKRFETVFTLGPSGEVLVVERLQTRLPELIDSPTDYGKS